MATSTVAFKRGDTWRYTLTLRDDGEPVDLTGSSLRMHLRDKRSRVKILAVAGDMLTLGEVEGVPARYTAVVDPEVTQLIDPGVYATDVEYTFVDGSVLTSQTFQVRVIQDETYDDD
jgi:hypothetical protein